jgi:hypothetical protein
MVNNLQSSFSFYIFLTMYNIVVITFSSLTMSKHRPLSDKELLDLIDQGLSDIEYLSNDEDDGDGWESDIF